MVNTGFLRPGRGTTPKYFHPNMSVSQSVHMGGWSAPGGLHQGGLHLRGWADPPSDITGYGQRAGGTHHSGMHSCCTNLTENCMENLNFWPIDGGKCQWSPSY